MSRALRQSILAASLGVALIAPIAHADAPDAAPATLPETQPSTQPTTRTAADLDQILNDLSSDDFPRRQQAADALGDLKASSLPRLKSVAANTTDVDARNIIQAAIKRIEEHASTSPSLLTLHLKDAPADDAIKAMAPQLAFDLACENPDSFKDTKITIDADNQPFWAVMKQLTSQWPLRVLLQINDPNRIVLQTSGQNYLNDRSQVVGPFLLCPVSMQSNSMIDLLQPVPVARLRMVMLQVAVLIEPKLRASAVSVVVKEAVDENGKSVAASDQPRMPGGLVQMLPPGSMMMVRLSPPANAGKMIARLSGVIRCRVPVRTKLIEVGDISDGKEHTVDLNGRSIKVTINAHDKQCDVKLGVPQNINIQDELSLAMVRDLRVYDSDGHALFRRPPQQTMNGRSWEFTIPFMREGTILGRNSPAVGEGAKLSWDLPVETKEVELPFEMTNIPLTQ